MIKVARVKVAQYHETLGSVPIGRTGELIVVSRHWNIVSTFTGVQCSRTTCVDEQICLGGTPQRWIGIGICENRTIVLPTSNNSLQTAAAFLAGLTGIYSPM